MFWPAASPVSYRKLTWTMLPISFGSMDTSLAWRLTLVVCSRISATWSRIQFTNSSAPRMSDSTNRGTRIIRCCTTRVVTPPDWEIARAPRVAEATSAPSVVANGA